MGIIRQKKPINMKTSLIICCYNRPQYLSRCFESLQRADLSGLYEILVIDDHSTDPEIKRLINDFKVDGTQVTVIRKGKNQGIKHSLLIGYMIAFEHSDIVINLDGDAIVRRDFVSVLLGLKNKFPTNIVSGFNTTVKNRNPIIKEHDTYFEKKYASGINMVINKDEYENYILPAISMPVGNHDFEASKLHLADGKSVIVSKPSICQHIGLRSSMGHGASEAEPPDVADDFVDDYSGSDLLQSTYLVNIQKNKLSLLLENVTLIGVDGFNIHRLIHAANISCQRVKFGSIKLLTHLPSDDPRVIKIRPILSSKDYSQFVLKELVNYVDTDYILIFQHDGFVINPFAWTNEFLKYDWVGASWKFRPEKRTANGGFSLRSKRICEAIRDDDNIYLQNDSIINNFAEDHVLNYIYREYLAEKHNMKIAPEEVCDKFSIEAWGVKPPENRYNGSFGFHGYSVDFNHSDLPYIPYKLPNRTIL